MYGKKLTRGKQRKRIGIALLFLILAVGILSAAFLNRYRRTELIITNGEKSIYGQLYLPRWRRGPVPLIILGHGYGGSYSDNLDYGRYLAKRGIGCYVFDFCGGSKDSKSSGQMQDMTIYTEMEDLNDIVDHMLAQDWLDKDGLFLAGKSLGGGVAALVGAERPDDIAGLILHYPFFIYSPALRDADEEEDEDLSQYYVVENVFDRIAGYDKSVLIFNGNKDKYVPLAYTQMAVDSYEEARLVTMEGSGHGFRGKAREEVKEQMCSFVQEVLQKK